MNSLHRLAVTCVILVLASGPAAAGGTGPIIDGFGATYEVPDPGFPTPEGHTYRVVFDVSGSPEDAGQLNKGIETAARFLNMHARAGVTQDRMHLALVVHGQAGKDTLGHPAYRKRFGVDNPNLPLLDRLHGAGVEVILCGQTAAHRGFGREELAAGVKVALSAMTALVVLQDRGFALVSF